MNALRIAISVFLVIVIGLCVAGWVWAGGQPESFQAGGARAVLTIGALASAGGLLVLWRDQSRQTQ